jgi:hypothetical protein
MFIRVLGFFSFVGKDIMVWFPVKSYCLFEVDLGNISSSGDEGTNGTGISDTWRAIQNTLSEHKWSLVSKPYVLVDWLWWSKTDVSELRPIVHPRVIAMWTMVWWYRLGLTPNLSTRALWQPPVLSGGPVSRDISGASRIMDEGNGNLVCPSPWDFERLLTCSKVLRHGISGFTSHSKEGVVRIFVALKNPSPWPGSNQRPLGPVASTLTTAPPRLQIICTTDDVLPQTELLSGPNTACSDWSFSWFSSVPPGDDRIIL